MALTSGDNHDRQRDDDRCRPGPDRPGSERGSALVEYVLLLMLIAVVCLVAAGFLGQSTSTTYSSVAGHVSIPGP